MPKRRHKRSGRRFIQLFSNVKRSTAYHGLTTNARSALIELIDRFNGCNNGAIVLGVRELAYELRCSIATVGGIPVSRSTLGFAITLINWRE